MKSREAAIPPADRFERLSRAADRLVASYAAAGKPDEVKKWQAVRAGYRETLPPPRREAR
jgi:hypothetical protein